MGRRRGPPRRYRSRPSQAESPEEHHHSIEGTWDRYEERDPDQGAWDRYKGRDPDEGTWDRYRERDRGGAAAPPAAAEPQPELEPPHTKYRKGDPAWEAYLEEVRRRARQLDEKLGKEEDHRGHDHDPGPKGE